MIYLTHRPKNRTDYFLILISILVYVLVCITLVSCATRPTVPSSDPSTFLSVFLPPGANFTDSADLFAVIPVSGNEDLLRTVVSPYLPKKSADELLDRTKIIYAAVSPQTASFKIAAQGKFSRSIIPFLFTRSSGWTKKYCNSQNLPVPFQTYYEAQTGTHSFVQAAIPYSGLVLSASTGMQMMLERAALNQPPPMLDDRVLGLFAQSSESDIVFYLPNPAPLLKVFLGESLTLPFLSLAGTCTPVYENSILDGYTADIYLTLSDSRFVRPATVLLKNVLLFSGAHILAGTGSDIIIKDLKLDVSALSLFFPE